MNGVTTEQMAHLLSFECSRRRTPKPYVLLSDKSIEQRRAELAAERAVNPVTNESIQALLARIHD